jgi:hypothetical protein
LAIPNTHERAPESRHPLDLLRERGARFEATRKASVERERGRLASPREGGVDGAQAQRGRHVVAGRVEEHGRVVGRPDDGEDGEILRRDEPLGIPRNPLSRGTAKLELVEPDLLKPVRGEHVDDAAAVVDDAAAKLPGDALQPVEPGGVEVEAREPDRLRGERAREEDRRPARDADESAPVAAARFLGQPQVDAANAKGHRASPHE